MPWHANFKRERLQEKRTHAGGYELQLPWWLVLGHTMMKGDMGYKIRRKVWRLVLVLEMQASCGMTSVGR